MTKLSQTRAKDRKLMMAQVLALFPNARIDHYCGPREVACYLDLGQINVRLSFDGRVHNEVFVLPWNSRGTMGN